MPFKIQEDKVIEVKPLKLTKDTKSVLKQSDKQKSIVDKLKQYLNTLCIKEYKAYT